jgi:Uma2 family endonuclease
MATVPETALRPPEQVELHTGDRMTREEFHRIYEQTPEHFRAELIGGIVYVASPLKRRHGTNHLPLGTLFFTYEGHTPGVESGDNTTILLGEEGEPQPDLFLRILPEYGGQSRTTADDYVEGAPELIAEVAHSSRAIDLHAKRDDYTRYGVLEYLVLSLRDRRLFWFDLRARQDLQPDADGVYRLRSFPGLWVHGEALLARDHRRLTATLEQGLATNEHADFVARLATARRGPRPPAPRKQPKRKKS